MEQVLRLGVDPRPGIRGMKQWDAAAGRTKASTMDLDGAVRTLAAAFGAFKLGQAAKDAVMMAARYETLGVVMQVVGRNAGYSAGEMSGFEDGLRSTGIAAIESRESIAKLVQANIDLSQSTDLARLAQDAAVIAGLNSSEAFGRLVHGIQAAEVRTLRLMGLNVDFEASYAKLAAELGKTTAQLTDVEKTQARVNAVMEKGPDIAGSYEASMDTAGKQLGSMKRQTDDLMVSLGSLVLDEFAARVFQASDALKDMQTFVNENEASLRHLAQVAIAAGEAIAAPFVAIVRILFNVGQQVGEVANALSAVARLDFRELEQSSARMEGNWQDMGDALNNNKAAWANLLETLNTVRGAVDEVGGSYSAVARTITEKTETVTVAISEQVDALADQIRLYERSLDVQNRVRESLLQNARAQAQILGILQSGQATWAEEVDLLELSAQAANTFREELLKLGPAGVQAARAILDTGLMEFPEALNQHMTRLSGAAEDSAETFEHEWLSAVNIVGASLGGLGSQVANIVTAFATGGIAAGGAALFGSLIGSIGTGRSRIAELEDQRRMAEEARRAADALRDFTRALEEDLAIRAAMARGDQSTAARLRLENAHTQELEAFFEQFGKVFTDFADLSVSELREAFGIWSQMYDLQSDEMKAWLDQWLQMVGVHSAEMDNILNDSAEVRGREAEMAREAARAFEEAERAYQTFVNTVLSLTQRIANLRGDRVGSLRAGQAMELFNLPEDTPGEIRELIGWIQAVELAQLERDLLLQEVNEAMESDLAAIREAADAQIEAIRKAADAQIAILEEQAKVVEEQLKVARANLQAQEQMVRTLGRVVQALSEALDEMLLGPMSPLDPISQLMEARRQFESLVSLAMGGDAGAAQGLPAAMQALLTASDAVNATGPGYVEDFERSRAAMEAIRNQFGAQLTVEERILEELIAQTQHLQAQIDSLRTQRDAIQQAAQMQIGAIRDQAEMQMAAVRDAAAAQIAEIERAHAGAMDFAWKQIQILLDILHSQLRQEELARDLVKMGLPTSDPHPIWEPPTFRSESRVAPAVTASSGPMQVVDPVNAEGLARLENRLASIEASNQRTERQLANILAGA